MTKKNKIKSIKDILKGITKKTIKENFKREAEKSYDIGKIFEQMELDLISSMHRAFYFHKREEIKEGFKFEQWQLTKLRELEKYRKRNKDIVDSYTPVIQATIERELRDNFTKGQDRVNTLNKVKSFFKPKEATIQFPDDISNRQTIKEYLNKDTPAPMETDFFGVNEKKLESLIKSVKNDINNAQYSVLRKMDDVYRQTIFKTQFYMQSGTKTLYQAIDMATKDFLDKGINSITYTNGKRVNIASYAEMCLRTASHRATLLGEGKKRNEYGIYTVVVSAHANTCKMCAPWQGQVLIDDVFSNLNIDYISKNSKYKLLSEAIDKGLLHPNCRHTLATYLEGITKLPTVPNTEEAIETYKAEQRQRAYERAIRKQKRIVEGTLDEDTKKAEIAKLRRIQKDLSEHLSKHTELRRNYNREK